jgi:hypothetical protein
LMTLSSLISSGVLAGNMVMDAMDVQVKLIELSIWDRAQLTG